MYLEFIRKQKIFAIMFLALNSLCIYTYANDKNEIFDENKINSLTILSDDLINKETFFSFRSSKDFLNFENDFVVNEDLTYSQQENKLEFEIEENEEIPLLPKNISFMEKKLWGTNGFFRTIGITSELTPEQRQKELTWRRTFLDLHQTVGLISWGLMASTVITGQLWLDGKMDSPIWHKRLLYATIGTYNLTGLIALITPPPFERRDEFSTISFHKLAAWIHFVGMIATPILGKAINSSNDYYKSAQIHQTMGYITFSVYTAAMLAIILFE